MYMRNDHAYSWILFSNMSGQMQKEALPVRKQVLSALPILLL